MIHREFCKYCGKPLIRREQIRFCSVACAGMARRQGDVIYIFSSDNQIGYGKLLTGETFLFDYEDFPKIKDRMWYGSVQGAHGEIYILDCRGSKIQEVILNIPEGLYVDHINLNTLDNRKSNLRLCSHRDNLCNRDLQTNNTSGVSGVHWNKNRRTWNARVKYYGQEIHLGAYHSFQEAVQARNEGMKWLYGEFGRYNDVPKAPPHIREYVQTKCSRFLKETAVLQLEVLENG